MIRRVSFWIIATATVGCSIRNGGADGRFTYNLGRRDTLTLYAQYSECGEWGGHQEWLRIYRGEDDELWAVYQRDTVVTCQGPIQHNRKPLTPRMILLTEDHRGAILRYMHDLLDRSLETDMPQGYGEHFSVRRSDARLVISRTIPGYRAFDDLIGSVVK